MSGIASLQSQNTQEKLGGAYIRAVVARAGCTLVDHGRDESGHDYTIKPVIFRNGRIRDGSWSINVQAKSTFNYAVRDDHIVYELDALNYSDLIAPDAFTPLILVVYAMPRDASEWLLQVEDRLEMRNCAYWVSLRGSRSTANKRSVTVNLPRSQVFTAEAVRQMLERVEKGEPL